MGLRYRPRIKIGNATIGKTGVSFRTGIPGLTYRHDFNRARSTSSAGNDEPFRPTVSYSVVMTLLFWVALSVVTWILGTFIGPFWYFLAPFIFIWGVLKPSIRAITGKANDIELTSSERNIQTVEGLVKLAIFGLAVTAGYSKFKTDEVKYAFDMPALQMKNLMVGMPASRIKQVEKKKPYLETDWSKTYKKSTFAGETGQVDYKIKDGLIDEIEFSKEGDSKAYPKLLGLLNAKYGLTRDSSEMSSTWKNDSINLEIRKSDADVYIRLYPNPYYSKK